MAKQSPSDWRLPRKCEGCGARFIPKRPWGRFHNAECQRKAWEANRVRVRLTQADFAKLREII